VMHIREVLWVPMIPTHEADIIRIFSAMIAPLNLDDDVEPEPLAEEPLLPRPLRPLRPRSSPPLPLPPLADMVLE
jgi:hypothetical protein